MFRTYRQAQGLANLSILSLATDSHGFLWVATQNGVYRFLGSSFQRFGADEGIAERNVAQVLAPPDGTVWAATSKNLYRWDGQRFQTAGPQPLVLEQPAAIAAESPGHLLVLADGRMHRLDYAPDGSFLGFHDALPGPLTAAHPFLNQVGSITIAPDGTLWMACGHLLCAWQHGGLKVWGKEQGLPEELYGSILQGRRGDLWAVGEHHVVELPQAGGRFVDHTPFASAQSEKFGQLAIAEDRSGRILVPLEKVVARWDGTAWQRIGESNNLRSAHMNALLFDTQGDLWLGSFGTGLYHWVGYEDWEGWSDRQGLPSPSIWSVGLFRGGKALVGTEHGPAVVDPQSGAVTSWFSESEWKYGVVNGMSEGPQGTILASVASGSLLRIQSKSPRVTVIGALDTWIHKIFTDPGGRTFILTHRKGVFDAGNLTGKTQLLPIPALDAILKAAAVFSSGCATPGIDWFLTRTGLIEFARNRWTRVSVDGFPQPVPGLREMVCAADGSLWIAGRESGIWHVTGQDTHLHATELVLPGEARSMSVISLLADRRGWLWIGTDDGILIWNGASWRHLSQDDGLIWNDLNSDAIATAPDDSIWIGTSRGVAHTLHPGQIFAQAAPQIAMIRIRRGVQTLPLTGELDIPWSRQDLSFEFATPDSPDGRAFHYRIAGLQSAWIETEDATARFSALPPGDYQFEVFAQDRIGGLRSPVLTVGFRILPPWWRTAWCEALYALSGVLVILLVYHLRTRQLVARQHRLEQLVLGRTAELEASQKKLRLQATHDGLTGLLNRVAILEAFDLELMRAQREDGHIALVLADLDHFKQVNDTRGHLAGDEALRRFSAALIQNIRPYDYAGRYGGEEFLLVLTGITPDALEERLASLHTSITHLGVREGETEFFITCSMGVVHLEPRRRPTGQQLALAAADENLYVAKQEGRNRFVLRSPTLSEAIHP